MIDSVARVTAAAAERPIREPVEDGLKRPPTRQGASLVLRTLALVCAILAGATWYSESARSDADLAPRVEVFKSPTCGCCTKWADHLETNGFRVQSTDVTNLSEIKRRHGVPQHSQACHTAVVDGYVIEGHVPASDIKRLLRERPAVRGLVAPGMPLGSPGMESRTPHPYSVYSFDEAGRRTLFSRHP